MKNNESPPLLAVYLLFAFLTLQYATNLLGTSEQIAERQSNKVTDQFKQVQDKLHHLQEAINKQQLPPATPAPDEPEIVQIPSPKPPPKGKNKTYYATKPSQPAPVKPRP